LTSSQGCTCNDGGKSSIRATDERGFRASRVGKGPKNIKNRRYADLSPRRTRESKGGVEGGSKSEGDPHQLCALGDLIRGEVQGQAKCLEDIGCAGAGGSRSITVLDDPGTSGSAHDRSHCGYVDGPGTIASGAHNV
jgi:hypothetical protein